MKKTTLQIISVTLLIISLGHSQTYAQLGNLKSLKDKTSKLNKKNNKDKDTKSDGNSTSKTYEVNAYSKHMDDGYKFKEEKKYLEALTSFNSALKEKPGDYSAKNQVSQAETSVKDFYMSKISKDIENGNCEQAEKDLAAVVKAIEVWRQEDYYTREIAKCKESAGANAVASDNKAKIDALASGSGNFYSDFSKKNYDSNFSVGQDLFVKFKFDKTMVEYFSEFGIEPAHNAYAFFTVYIDGKKQFVDGPYHFASNYSKVLKDLDLPLCVSAIDFTKMMKNNPGLLSTNKEVWLLQQVSNPAGITNKYIMSAIQNMPNGTHKVKVEFGLGEKSDKAPKGTVAKGEVNISVDDASRKELYKRGPKYMQPIDDNEKGKFEFSNSSYEFGNGNLSITLKLPQVPKYYNMKWCQSMSCDYDHGELIFVAELDGKYLAAWQTTFWNEKYETQKEFKALILPNTDNNLKNDLADYNSSVFFEKVGNDNPIPYALFDLLYSNKLNAGKHTLKLKVYSPEIQPMGDTDFEASSFQMIAENEVSFNVSSNTKSNLTASSSAGKLKHAGGSWAAVDAYLKNSTTHGQATILDVATYTQWKVTVNAFGTPLYRNCTARILYKTKNGNVRILNGVDVKEDYEGGTYSKPYFKARLQHFYLIGPGGLNSMHYPVPESKVK